MELPSTFLDWVALIGGILGVVAFAITAKNIWEWITGYVAVSLKIAKNEGRVVVETSVENTSVWRREINWAFLIISPRGNDFLEPLKSQTTKKLKSTNDLINLKTDKQLSEDGVDLIPLTFFYREQVSVADEKITYTEILENPGTGIYDVRFFVFPKSVRHGLHRCNHGAFIVS
jgi:hypothetical protein